jgi:ABC-2 type transport system permease protein
MENFYIYLRLATASIKSRMEYRASFMIFMGTIIVFYIAQVLTIGVVISRFRNIGGWSMGEMAFLYSLLVLSQGIVSSVFSGLLDFSTIVRDGSFDRFMIRPLSTLGQVIMTGFEITGLAHIVLGIAAVVLANSMIEIHWTWEKMLMLVFVILGGSCILAGIRVLIAAVAFKAINNQSLVHLFVFSSKEFLLYPMNIYSSGVKILLTFVLPLGFINFYPAHYFLDKSGEGLFHPYFIFATFPVGVITFLFSLWIWKLGKTAYESAGG